MSGLISLPFTSSGASLQAPPGTGDNLLTGTATHGLAGTGSSTGWKPLSEVCFLKDSQITLSDKSKKLIQDLQENDELLSYKLDDFDNLNQDLEYVLNWYSDDFKGGLSTAKVISVQQKETNQYIIINNKLKVTPEHMILIKKDDTVEWFPAKNIDKSCLLFTNNDEFEIVNDIQIVDKSTYVYNISVNKIKNYFVEDYLVHSSSKCDECQK
jgi:hypothetical protein